MFNLVEIVEDKMQAEMQQSKGCIMYEWWTPSSMQYMALFAVYMPEVSVYRSGMLL